ncbi:MAG: DNA methyltransferase, partial [Deltaproteobacteria bacterium]|nr:DNA methyltransferase [Deltaproteobacteria bacterium]
PSNHFQRMHDVILFYAKSPSGPEIFNVEYEPNSPSYIKRFKGKTQMLDPETKTRKITLDSLSKGLPLRDVWQIPIIAGFGKERLGYPTQKPEALLERIIKASSNEGDLVLDPFCGCGTAIAVAERLHRRWLGIDITHLAITLIKNRLRTAFDDELSDYAVFGVPKDLAGARALARQNRYQFEWWALGLVDARPGQEKKKGADTGIDGIINFIDDPSGKAKRLIVQVKSGKVSVNQVRDLKGVLEREQAAIGAFISLSEPTAPMLKEAATAGFYQPEHLPGLDFPRLQILTIEELLAGKKLEYPRIAPDVTFKKAPRQRKGPAPEDKQNNLL